MYVKIFVSVRVLGVCGRGTFLRAWLPGVRYLEVNLYWKVTLGAGVLCTVRKREAVAYVLQSC